MNVWKSEYVLAFTDIHYNNRKIPMTLHQHQQEEDEFCKIQNRRLQNNLNSFKKEFFDFVPKTIVRHVAVFSGFGAVPKVQKLGSQVCQSCRSRKMLQEVWCARVDVKDSKAKNKLKMINSIRKRKQHRCNGNLSLHVLNIIEGIHKSARNGKKYYFNTTCAKPKYFTNKEINSIIK